MIKNHLKKLWFNEKEINIYLIIVEYKKILPSTISSLTKINRTTVYSIIKKLKNKVLITEDIQSKWKYILALPLENLHNILEQEKIELTKKESNIEKIITELSKFEQKNIHIPKIQFIEEDYLEKFLYSELNKWNNSILKYENKCWYWFQDHILVEQYETFITFF